MSQAAAILAALGGPGNIVEIEACITRLRTEIQDVSLVDEASLRAAGAHGVMRSGTVVQVVLGPEADTVASEIEDLLPDGPPLMQVLAPVSGTSLDVADVPDPVFASGMVGPGLAIEPRPGLQTALAPIAGRLAKLHPHAFLVVSDTGPGVLVHLGIDTVQMHGDGFTLVAGEHDVVSRRPGDRHLGPRLRHRHRPLRRVRRRGARLPGALRAAAAPRVRRSPPPTRSSTSAAERPRRASRARTPRGRRAGAPRCASRWPRPPRR